MRQHSQPRIAYVSFPYECGRYYFDAIVPLTISNLIVAIERQEDVECLLSAVRVLQKACYCR